MRYIILLIFSIIFLSCQPNKDKEALEEQLEQKNRELDLKQKELELKEKELAKKNTIDSLKGQDKSLSDLYNDVKQSVFLIYTKNDSSESQGSAFTINNTGIAISNYHVFENASDAIAINSENEEFLITEILEYSKDDDYIIFRLGNTTQMPFVELSENLPNIGENCFAIGNPNGLTQTLSNGIISSYRNNNKLIQTTAEITHGSSGGPLFNSKGKVIGITSGGYDEANLNFAINIQNVPVSKYVSPKKINPIISNIDEARIKSIINNYYEVISNEEWPRLFDIYTPTLKRYFDKFNYPDFKAVASASTYKKNFKINKTAYSIRWNTLKYNPTVEGMQVQFIMDYKIVRQNKNKASNFVLNIVMELNSSGMISSIYENILAKK